MKDSIFQMVYELVKQIPPGKVSTYGQIAFLLGNRRLSRVVGYATSRKLAIQRFPVIGSSIEKGSWPAPFSSTEFRNSVFCWK